MSSIEITDSSRTMNTTAKARIIGLVNKQDLRFFKLQIKTELHDVKIELKNDIQLIATKLNWVIGIGVFVICAFGGIAGFILHKLFEIASKV